MDQLSQGITEGYFEDDACVKKGINVGYKYSLVQLRQLTLDMENAVKNRSNKITVVNAGIMNAGKSSVYNALIGKKDYFKVQDIRTTTKNGEVLFKDDIYLVDTPGLEAVKLDTQTAYDAYKNAAVIVFVHSLNIGELHKNELEAINKIKKCFPDTKAFLERFILVGTRKDMESEDGQFDIVLTKIKKDMRVHCGIDSFASVFVSPTYYWIGVEADDEDTVEYSGIPELKKLIIDRLQKVVSTTNALFEKRMQGDKAVIISNLDRHKKICTSNIDAIKKKYESQKIAFAKETASLYKESQNILS